MSNSDLTDTLPQTGSLRRAGSPVWILDRSLSTLLWANHAALRFWGVTADSDIQLLNKGLRIVDLLPESQQDCWHDFALSYNQLTDSAVTELAVNPCEPTSESCLVQITPIQFKAQPTALLFFMLNSSSSRIPVSEQQAICIENTDTLIALYSSDNSLLYQNSTMTRIMDNAGKTLSSLFAQPEAAIRIQKTLESLPVVDLEQELVTTTGVHWFSLTVRKIEAVSGQDTYILLTANNSTKWHLAAAEAKKRALTDELTKLPNRAAMNAQLKQLIETSAEHSARFGLFFINLDRFKVINDSLGHAAGDSLLVEVAQRLLIATQGHGTVYRLSGDEFVVLFNEQVSTEQLSAHALRILEIMSSPATVGKHSLRIRPSIGICLYPTDARTVSGVLQHADAAMYLAKAEGNTFRFYDAQMTKTHSETSKRRMSLENDLATAVELNQLELYYQPKISCADLTVSGVEALLRWHHPEKGLVPPDEFIGIAEESGQIVKIGRWVLKAAMKQQQVWESIGMSIPVAINISAGQFHTGDLVKQVSDSMQASGCEPEAIELEITESMLLGDNNFIQNTLQRLSSMGIRLALDDFGTGFSNLAYLQKYPLDVLKIDKIFLADQKRSMLMDTILNMGKVLGLRVVAEGVENAKQAEWLIDKGCDYIQGYYYSRPLTAADATQYLLEHNAGDSKLGRSAA